MGIAALQVRYHHSYCYTLICSAIMICLQLSYQELLKINKFVQKEKEKKKG